MAADETPSYDLSGIGIPHPFSIDLASDYAVGVDYTVAEYRPAGVSWSETDRTQRLQVIPSGTFDSDVTADPEVVILNSGMPGPNGAAFGVRQGTSGLYYGADAYWRITNARGIRTGASVDYPAYTSCVALPDGTIVSATVRATTSGSVLQMHKRDASTKTWSSVFSKAIADTNARVCCAVIAPDGNIHVYWLATLDGVTSNVALYVSYDDGANFVLDSYDVGITSVTSPTHMRAVELDGQVAIWIGAANDKQYVSTDGGYNFEIVGLEETSAAVVDVRVTGSHVVALTVEDDSGTLKSYARTLGYLSSNLFDGEAQVLESSVTVAHHAWLGVVPDGTVYAYMPTSTAGLDCYYSLNGGVSWSEGPSASSSSTYVLSRGQAVHVRGEIIAVGVSTNSSGADTNGAFLLEHRYGGHSDLTLAYPRASLSNRTANIYRFTPIETLAEAGFTDGGTATRTHTVDHVNVTTAGTTSTNAQTIVSGGDFETRLTLDLRVNSGTQSTVVTSSDNAVKIDVTSTQIRAYDNSAGSPPSYTNHGASDFLQVRLVLNGANDAATVWYRDSDEDEERAWTELTNLTSLTTPTSNVSVSLQNATSTDVDYRLVEFDFANAANDSGLDDGVATDGSDTLGIPLPSTGTTYLTGGVSVRGTGGPATANDGGTYTVARNGSPYAKANLLPRHQSSVTRGWRSSGTSTSPLTTATTLKFTLDPEQEAATRWNSEVVALYGRNLVGISGFNILDSTSSLVSVDLRVSVNYDHSSGQIRMSETGSVSQGDWIARDALRGGYFEFANGEVRKIARNTSGCLTWGSTVAEERCRITLEGIDGTEDASGTGKIWPRDFLVLYYCRGNPVFTRLEIQFTAPGGGTHPLGPEGYRAMGLFGVFEMAVLGRAFDRTMSRDTSHPTTVTRRQDGSTEAYSFSDHANGTTEFAFVDSYTDAYEIRQSPADPSYVTVSANGSADPAASRFAVADDMEGIYRELLGAKVPCLGMPRIRRDAGSGDPITILSSATGGHGLDEAVYGRLTQPIRREQTGIGMHGIGSGYRIATVSIEVEG